jgi:hypothetical protein
MHGQPSRRAFGLRNLRIRVHCCCPMSDFANNRLTSSDEWSQKRLLQDATASKMQKKALRAFGCWELQAVGTCCDARSLSFPPTERRWKQFHQPKPFLTSSDSSRWLERTCDTSFGGRPLFSALLRVFRHLPEVRRGGATPLLHARSGHRPPRTIAARRILPEGPPADGKLRRCA